MFTKRMLSRWMRVAAVVVVISMPGQSVRAAVTIAELIAQQGSVISGDKVFDQFTFSSTGQMPLAEDVQVIAISDNSGGFGIRFMGGFIDQVDDITSIMSVGYRVAVTDSSKAISGALLQGNPSVVHGGSMTAMVSFAEVPTTLTVFDKVPGGTDLLDSVVFDKLYPEMNVALSLTGQALESGFVTASFVDQIFSQSDSGVIPEPASLLIWLATATFFGTALIWQRHRSLRLAAVDHRIR